MLSKVNTFTLHTLDLQYGNRRASVEINLQNKYTKLVGTCLKGTNGYAYNDYIMVCIPFRVYTHQYSRVAMGDCRYSDRGYYVNYISRPTEVFEALMRSKGFQTGNEYRLGRLTMALEILTVVKTLEDERVPMLALQREETISVLLTLLREQGMAEIADEWYEVLSSWRKPVFMPVPVSDLEDDAFASSVEGHPSGPAPDEQRSAQPSNGRSRGLPLSEPAQASVLEDLPRLTE